MQLAIPRFDLRLMLLRFLLFFLILTFCTARHDCAAFFAPSDLPFKPTYNLCFLTHTPFIPEPTQSALSRRDTTVRETKRAANTLPDTATLKSERSATVAADTSTLHVKQARMQDTVLAKADNTAKADSVTKPDSLAWRLRPELVALALPSFPALVKSIIALTGNCRLSMDYLHGLAITTSCSNANTWNFASATKKILPKRPHLQA